MNLHLDWCSYKSAKYACEHWHYSHKLPAGKIIKIGVWEYGSFIGCILFSRGATYNLGSPYKLTQIECCELTRIALTKHKNNVSRIIKIAIKLLKTKSPYLRLIISYADDAQNHFGAIYQAANWIYVGESKDTNIIVRGIKEHRRSLYSKYGTNSLLWIKEHIDNNAFVVPTKKYKYLYPLDDEMRKQIEPLRKPYPKKNASVVEKYNTTLSDVEAAVRI